MMTLLIVATLVCLVAITILAVHKASAKECSTSNNNDDDGKDDENNNISDHDPDGVTCNDNNKNHHHHHQQQDSNNNDLHSAHTKDKTPFLLSLPFP